MVASGDMALSSGTRLEKWVKIGNFLVRGLEEEEEEKRRHMGREYEGWSVSVARQARMARTTDCD